MRLRPFLRRFRSDFFNLTRFVVVTGFVTALVVGAAYGVVTEAWPAVKNHSYFRLRSVKVVCDSATAQPAELAARAGLYDGTSLWQIDPSQARSALASVSWVREARIQRLFPDRVAVEVYRREPVAATFGPDGPYLIDAEGVVYREEGVAPIVDLPYISGWADADSRAERVERLRTAMDVAAAAAARGIEVSEVHVEREGTLWLYPDHSGVPVRLGRNPNAQRAAARLVTVMNALPAGDVALLEIDLSYRDRAVLRARGGRVRTLISAFAGGRGAEIAQAQAHG